ncbi:MAG: phosphoribosylformylglycinamidine synthase subunit PurQ [Anaerolineae bacterium]|jgi:phosphoribosylformylglycinamidine synthase I|nr:phosphoribosylformylglycinamidine synthase subunit PurQ [Chloroflexota bacterium]
MSDPRVLILHAPGTNRDREAAQACVAAGGQAEIVHTNRLAGEPSLLDRYQMLVIPGGFSYGDDLGAGRLLANELLMRLRESMDAFVAAGKPVLGICNGFQTLVKAGYLPGPAPEQTVSLTNNRRGGFQCRWVRLRALPHSTSLFTRGLEEDILCPIAHGEGRLAVADTDQAQALLAQGLVPLQYVNTEDPAERDRVANTVPVSPAAGFPANPSGSVLDAAALCNAAGNVMGLMPHPEDHIHAFQHPRWARGARGGMGLVLFENGVRAARAFM